MLTNLKQEDSPNEDNNIDINYLHIKATSGMVRTFEQKENVSKYLCSINFDETCFEEGSLGWALCLKKQIQIIIVIQILKLNNQLIFLNSVILLLGIV